MRVYTKVSNAIEYMRQHPLVNTLFESDFVVQRNENTLVIIFSNNNILRRYLYYSEYQDIDLIDDLKMEIPL